MQRRFLAITPLFTDLQVKETRRVWRFATDLLHLQITTLCLCRSNASHTPRRLNYLYPLLLWFFPFSPPPRRCTHDGSLNFVCLAASAGNKCWGACQVCRSMYLKCFLVCRCLQCVYSGLKGIRHQHICNLQMAILAAFLLPQ